MEFTSSENGGRRRRQARSLYQSLHLHPQPPELDCSTASQMLKRGSKVEMFQRLLEVLSYEEGENRKESGERLSRQQRFARVHSERVIRHNWVAGRLQLSLLMLKARGGALGHLDTAAMRHEVSHKQKVCVKM